MPWAVVRGRKNPLHYGLPGRLRQVRRQRGLAMSAASLAAGLTNEAVSRIEQHRRIPRIDTIERVAATLGISPAWLVYGEGSEQPPGPSLDVQGVGKRLAAARLQRGLTRQALGSAAQLTGQTIASIETGGRFPRVDTIEQIAKALGVAPSWLAFGREDPLGAAVSETRPAQLD